MKYLTDKTPIKDKFSYSSTLSVKSGYLCTTKLNFLQLFGNSANTINDGNNL